MKDLIQKRLLTQIGIKVTSAREELGLTRKELSDITRVSSSHIQQIEKNGRKPTVEFLCALSIGLGVSMEYLFDDKIPIRTKQAMDKWNYDSYLKLSENDKHKFRTILRLIINDQCI